MRPYYGTSDFVKVNLSVNFSISTVIKFDTFIFPGGEPHVKLIQDLHIDRDTPIRIYQTIKSFEDFGYLALVVDALRRRYGSRRYMSLVLPYLPGARQDRVPTGKTEALTAKVYADLINNLKFDEVIVFDAHSNVSVGMLDNCKNLSNLDFVHKALKDIEDEFTLVAPDAGSVTKTEAITQYYYNTGQYVPDVIYCRKHRDPETGKLSEFSINVGDLDGKQCVIVDDICDGGGTFAGVASLLEKNGAGKLHLIVSHGIFSGLAYDNLRHFDSITTTNSWYSRHGTNMPQVKVIDFIKLYNL